jgi:argininosuccinate lyase
VSRLRERFGEPTDPDLRRFAGSLELDLQMLDEEIDASIAHATMLGEVGLLGPGETSDLTRGLERVRQEIRDGRWAPGEDHEDLHMALEHRLTELVGPLGGKLHTARSRNDQVQTDVRLWLRRRLDRVDAALGALLTVLLDRIDSDDGKALVPGFTHLQWGQPVLLGHHLLAHAWALSRDRERLAQARRRVDRSPLGACAMAGTSHPIDRGRTAELLAFGGVVENAMDAVAARDHEQEVAAACAICTGHLSRMAEELVLWSSREFALVRLPAAWTTGSSIMPQKRNPDAAELVRGKAARVEGDLMTLLSLTRGLPLAYNRDLQEGRRPLFDAVCTTLDCLGVMAAQWRALDVDRERYARVLDGDFCLATELADLLAARGVPFREAHAIVARAVRWCEERGTDLRGLTPEAARELHPALAEDLAPRLDARAAAERRASRGGTAWSEIRRQVRLLRETLGVAGRPIS